MMVVDYIIMNILFTMEFKFLVEYEVIINPYYDTIYFIHTKPYYILQNSFPLTNNSLCLWFKQKQNTHHHLDEN